MSDINIENFNDEIEFKVVIEKFKLYSLGVLKYWYIIILASIILGSALYYKSYKEKPLYTATIKYSVGNVNSFPLGNILGQFGLDANNSAIGKAIEFTTSRIILNEILFNKIEIESKTDFLANHIIYQYKLNETWNKLDNIKLKGELNNFTFKSSDISTFNETERYALKDICNIVYSSEAKRGLLIVDYETQTMVCRIQTSSINEKLSYYITKFIYERLVNKYYSKSASPLKKSLNSFKSSTDSLFGLIKATETKLAYFNDKHHNMVSQSAMVEKAMTEKELMKLTIAYSEMAKNQEMLDLSLKSVSGNIELIDEPFLPLPVEQPSKVMSFLIGALLGGSLSIVCVLFFVFYQRIINA